MDPSDSETAKEIIKIASIPLEFLKALCMPAAEQFGVILGEGLKIWRIKNITPILQDAMAKLEKRGSLNNVKMHPRIAIKIIEEGSLIEDPDLQKMWAGIFASSCTEDGTDETNLIFVNILSQLSSSQAKIIALPFIEGNYNKRYQYEGSEYTEIEKEKSALLAYTGLPTWGILERELEHLDGLGLAGFRTSRSSRDISIFIHYNEAALWLYARCQGHTGSLQEFISDFTNPL